MAALIAVSSPAVATSDDPPPTIPVGADDNNGRITILGEIDIPPGDPGVIDVVREGVHGEITPVIIRNNTSDIVYDVVVSASAINDAGDEVASGVSDGFEPYVLDVGDWAFGNMQFDTDDFSEVAEIIYEGHAEPYRGYLDRVRLGVRDTRYHDDGAFTGDAINDSDQEAFNVRIYVVCLDSPQIVGIGSGLTDVDPVPPDDSSPFTVELSHIATCPDWGVAGSGEAPSSADDWLERLA